MKIAFALEYSLGHSTHAENLKRIVQYASSIEPTYVNLPYHDTPGALSRLPGVRSNWSVRASLAAYLALRKQVNSLDAALFHTQVTSLFSSGLMRRLPSVISLDATPLQYDVLGEHYGHAPSGNKNIESLKRRLNVRAFSAARKIVTWSHWTKGSLVDSYGVAPEKISVIPPGIDTDQWEMPPVKYVPGVPLNLLFVGADFERKGGAILLNALEIASRSVNVHLHVVTKTDGVGAGIQNVTVHRDVSPNSGKLLELFRQADIFVFPTLADCLPLAIMEAMAAGRPIITTSVGALPEAVIHEDAGLIVPPSDPASLAGAIIKLCEDPGLRISLGCRARELALERFNARTNYNKLVDTVNSVARQ